MAVGCALPHLAAPRAAGNAQLWGCGLQWLLTTFDLQGAVLMAREA